MKNKIVLVFIILFTLYCDLYSQKHFSLVGTITCKQTNKPIPYASICIKNKTIGTVSNSEGQFVLHVPQTYKNDSIIISSIGYKMFKSKVVDCIGKDLDIELSLKVYDLSEIEVKPKDALEIVKQAVSKIPENYPTQPINMEGFYRELTFENDMCVELAEAACEFYYRPYNEQYSKTLNEVAINLNALSESHYDYFIRNHFWTLYYNPNDKLKIKEARASNLFHKQRFKVIPRGGPMKCAAFDLVKNIHFFLHPKNFKRYRYTLADITNYNNREVYKIKYLNKKDRKFFGHIYIDVETLAFVSLEFEEFEQEKAEENNRYWVQALYDKGKRRCKDFERMTGGKVLIDYIFIKGKWYLNHVKIIEKFEFIFSKYYKAKSQTPKIDYIIEQELLINNIKKDCVDSTFNSPFANSLNNVIYDYDLNYNDSFWNNYNRIKTTPLQDSLMHQLELYAPLNNQFKKMLTFNERMEPPYAQNIARFNPYTELFDDYSWMEDIHEPSVMKYIEAENDYTNNYMLKLKGLRKRIYTELLNSEPEREGGADLKKRIGEFSYYFKSKENGFFDNLYRIKEGAIEEELVIDFNKIAKGKLSFGIGEYYINQKNEIIAYEQYESGGYQNIVVFRDISSGLVIDSLINAIELIWKKNNLEVYYLTWDSINRVCELKIHRIGCPQDDDITVYYEDNPTNRLSILPSENKDYLIFESSNDFYNNEYYLIEKNGKKDTIYCIAKRKEHVRYNMQVFEESIYCLRLDERNGYELFSVNINNPKQRYWQKLNYKPKTSMAYGPILTKNYIVILESDSLKRNIIILNRKGDYITTIKFNDEEVYELNIVFDYESQKKDIIKYTYSSLKTPTRLFEYSINENVIKVLKEKKINDFNKEDYTLSLLWAPSKNGALIPITVFYNNKLINKKGDQPLLIEGYGSFGIETFRGFKSSILPLVDRGFVYAIAHIRGGGGLGDSWHEQGMQLLKKNTFTDFITCTEFLIKKKYSSKGKIVARGQSAGGLVMGTVANMRPDLFNTVILEVPFLDVLKSVTDKSAKFSTENWGEFGNPKKKEIFEYIKSYSPYQNIIKQNYPHMLFSIGLNDTKVEFWQSLKAVAKLRKLKIGDQKLFLKTDLFAGHSGKMNPHSGLIDDAFIYAFILNNLGID